MKHSATLSEARARATWPLPEPILTYFPDARLVPSDRDLDATDTRPQARRSREQRVVRIDKRPAVQHFSPREGALMAEATGGFGHVSVMLDRCFELLRPALTRRHADGSGAVLVDGTVGAGGHAERFLAELPGLRLIGVDRDPTALDIVRARLARFADRLTLVQTRYDEIEAALSQAGYGPTASVDGVLFDLGVSSMQLDRAERGFSYAQDAPLDMRMDPTSPLTAAEILNTYDEAALADILRRFGEEKLARRIAAHIARRRARSPFTSTAELVEVIYQAVPAPARRTGGHPAKRTFQALRIAVNSELDALRDAMPAALDAVAVDGRIVVMSYQSLEDRIVKRVFAAATTSSTPSDLPVELPGHAPQFRLLTRGAERADDTEVAQNPRSAAVRLRAIQRVRSKPDAARKGGS